MSEITDKHLYSDNFNFINRDSRIF